MRYEFKQEDAYGIAQHLGIRAKKRGNELNFDRCPYCRGGKNSDKQTFSINLLTGAYNCQRSSCGASGSFYNLAKDFGYDLGFEYEEYIAPTKKYKQLKQPKEKIEPKDKAIQYLESRGISSVTATMFQITVRDDNPKIMVFPFFNPDGELTFVKYRNMNFQKGKDKAKEWPEADTKPILYGMSVCEARDRLIVTEGELDCLSLYQAGYRCVTSVPMGVKNFKWVPYCWDWLRQFKEILVFGDHENGHITLVEDFAKRFTWATIYHPREEDYKDCKDANDILRKYGVEQLGKCVEDAKPLETNGVIQLADVQPVDIYSIPKLKTGLSEIDKGLCGGLPFGYINIIGGKRGKGKSTFASQIYVNAREQGFKCLAYSGELSNAQFRAWIDFQVAGPNNVVVNDFDGYKQYLVTKPNEKKINNWFADECYLFDNSMVCDERIDLIKVIEESIKREGVQVILIDNLMTGIDLMESNGNEYERQKEFVDALARMVLRYDVMIILVAHKRKTGKEVVDENDEISGNSYITNRAGVILNYDGYTDAEIEKGEGEECDRKITITKNRLFGYTNFKGVKAHFNPQSKRIYGDNDSYTFDYEPFAAEKRQIKEDNPFD